MLCQRVGLQDGETENYSKHKIGRRWGRKDKDKNRGKDRDKDKNRHKERQIQRETNSKRRRLEGDLCGRPRVSQDTESAAKHKEEIDFKTHIDG